jgi:DNA repair protein RecN (Recombination protein N)
MLSHLSIRNIVLIEALDLGFAPGLGVLTGETGAGKSILLDALGLVLGMRADGAGARGRGCGQRYRQLRCFGAAGRGAGRAGRCRGGGGAGRADPDPPPVEGRWRIARFINDQPVSVALLRELAPALVEIHGQHDDRGLVNPRASRAA